MINKKIKWMPVVIAACLCLIFAVPAFAATTPSFIALLSGLGSEFEGKLQPINIISEDNGIKMEVVSVMNDGETAIIYLTLQDLTGNRVDKSFWLYNYHIECDGENITCLPYLPELLNYDEATNTATVRLIADIIDSGIDTLNGKKITVYVEEFFSNKQEFDDFDTGINLSEITDEVNTVKVDMCDFFGDAMSWLMHEGFFEEQKQTIDILKPNELHIPIPGVDFAYISNIGIIDGRLHVQMCRNYSTTSMFITDYLALIADSPDAVKGNDYFEWDDYIYLPSFGTNFYVDQKGNIINYDEYIKNSYVNYDEYEEGKIYPEYSEIIYKANPDILPNCKLMASDFSVYRNYSPCNLQATFEIDALKGSKSAECDIDLGGLRLQKINLSPLGITLFSNEDEAYTVSMDIFVTMADCSVEKFGTLTIEKSMDYGNVSEISGWSLSDSSNVMAVSSKHGLNGEFNIKLIFNEPFDYEKAAFVTINCNTVFLK